MRIAVLTSSLPPHSVGGAETQAHRTAIGLAGRGHAVTVFARAVPGDVAGVERTRGVTWVRIGVPPIPGLSFAAHVLRFRTAWRRHEGPQHGVILAYQTVINGVLGRLAEGDAPLVTWIRSEWEIRPDWSRKYRVLTPWVLRGSRRILVQAEPLRETLLSGVSGGRDLVSRVRVLPNAVEIGPEPTYENRRGAVTLGRLVPDKGLDVLLDALRRMDDPPPLRILGDGPLRTELQKQAAGLDVTFEGRVAPEDVAGRLAPARFFVLSSRSEGFPNAILEAMERGLPTVATRVGGVPSVVRDGETGLLVAPDDSPALAIAMTAMQQNPERWEHMARSARTAANAFGWEAHLDALEGVLREAVGART